MTKRTRTKKPETATPAATPAPAAAPAAKPSAPKAPKAPQVVMQVCFGCGYRASADVSPPWPKLGITGLKERIGFCPACAPRLEGRNLARLSDLTAALGTESYLGRKYPKADDPKIIDAARDKTVVAEIRKGDQQWAERLRG